MTDFNIIHGVATATFQTFDCSSVDLIVTDPPHLCRCKDRSGRTLQNDDSA